MKDSRRETLNFKDILLYLKHRIAKHLDNFTFRSLYFKKVSLIGGLVPNFYALPTGVVYQALALYSNIQQTPGLLAGEQMCLYVLKAAEPSS